ncbi:MAG: hypothetical protein SCM88_08285 [Bacillota bacterium]|nr:hypothetical protein [Bacillota bacterium]
MMRSFYLEFSGVAGVGKTTVCNELYKALCSRNINCSKVNGSKIPFIQKCNLKIFLSAIYIAIKAKPKLKYAVLVLKEIKNLYASQIKIEYFKTLPGIHLSDQGVFQSVGTLYKYSSLKVLPNLWNDKTIKIILIPDLLVTLRAETKTIIEQRYKRKNLKTNDIKDSDYQYIETIQKRGEKNNNDVKYILKKCENFNHISVWNGGRNENIADIVNEIINYIIEVRRIDL